MTAKLREEKRLKEGLTANLEKNKQEILLMENELTSKKNTLVLSEDEVKIKIFQRKQVQKEQQEISFKIEEKKKLEQETEKTKIMISNKKDSILENMKVIGQINQEINKLSEFSFEESKISGLEAELISCKNQKQEMEEKKIKLASEINSLESKNKENEEIKKKIQKIDICPTCLQNVDPVYKSNVVNNFDSDTAKNIKRMSELQIENKILLDKSTKLNTEILTKEKNLGELRILKVRLQGVQEKRQRLDQINKTNISLQKDLEILERHKEMRDMEFINKRLEEEDES